MAALVGDCALSPAHIGIAPVSYRQCVCPAASLLWGREACAEGIAVTVLSLGLPCMPALILGRLSFGLSWLFPAQNRPSDR